MAYKISFRSYERDLRKKLYNISNNREIEAAKYVVKELKKAVSKKTRSLAGSPPGRFSGKLKRGITWSVDSFSAYVGFMRPAYHAHLLEFGASGTRNTKKGKNTGNLKARPFFGVTFENCADTVERIFSRRWF